MNGQRFVAFLTATAISVLIAGACGGTEESLHAEFLPSTTELTPLVTPPPGNGWVQVGGLTIDMAFTCFAPGAGDVVAVGVGEHPMSGDAVKALVQGFLGRPYIGVMIGEEVVLEAALEDPLEVYLHNDKITAGSIRWQENLDLKSGQGEPAGFGALFVDCPNYESGLPDNY